MSTIDELLEKIDVFTTFDDGISGYTEIEVIEVEHITEKAALIACDDNAAVWVPLSVLKCDDTRTVFVESWFYNRNF